MEIRQLRAFYQTAFSKSFTKASNELYLTQPTITAHVRSLENELGVVLLQRTTKSITLTPAGEKLFKYAENILALEKKAKREIVNENVKKLCIGTSTAPAKKVIQFVSDFCVTNKSIQFLINEEGSLDVIDNILNGIYDLGFVGKKYDNNLIYKNISDDYLVLILPKTKYYKNLLEENDICKILNTEQYVQRTNDSATNYFINKFLEKENIKQLNTIVTLNKPEQIVNAVRLGLGVSIMSFNFLESLNALNDVYYLNITDTDTRRNLYLVYKKEIYINKTKNEFIKFINSKIEK